LLDEINSSFDPTENVRKDFQIDSDSDSMGDSDLDQLESYNLRERKNLKYLKKLFKYNFVKTNYKKKNTTFLHS